MDKQNLESPNSDIEKKPFEREVRKNEPDQITISSSQNESNDVIEASEVDASPNLLSNVEVDETTETLRKLEVEAVTKQTMDVLREAVMELRSLHDGSVVSVDDVDDVELLQKGKENEEGNESATMILNSGQEGNRAILQKYLQVYQRHNDKLFDLVLKLGTKHKVLFDDLLQIAKAEPMNKKIFIRGLPWTTTEEGLRKAFEKYGEIANVSISYDKDTGRSKGYGFITFVHAETALSVAEENEKEIDGRQCFYNLAEIRKENVNQNTSDNKFPENNSFMMMNMAMNNQNQFQHDQLPNSIPYQVYNPNSYPPNFQQVNSSNSQFRMNNSSNHYSQPLSSYQEQYSTGPNSNMSYNDYPYNPQSHRMQHGNPYQGNQNSYLGGNNEQLQSYKLHNKRHPNKIYSTHSFSKRYHSKPRYPYNPSLSQTGMHSNSSISGNFSNYSGGGTETFGGGNYNNFKEAHQSYGQRPNYQQTVPNNHLNPSSDITGTGTPNERVGYYRDTNITIQGKGDGDLTEKGNSCQQVPSNDTFQENIPYTDSDSFAPATCSKKLYIRSLAYATTQETIRKVFERYGAVEEVYIVTDRSGNKSKGCAFVTFQTIEGAKNALEQPSKEIDGRITISSYANTTPPMSQKKDYPLRTSLDQEERNIVAENDFN